MIAKISQAHTKKNMLSCSNLLMEILFCSVVLKHVKKCKELYLAMHSQID